MKKSRIFLALAGLALIFAGCSDIGSGGDAAVSSGYGTPSDSGKALSFSVTSDDNLLTFNPDDGRTILPPAVDASGNAVKFYLGYIDSLSTTTTEKLYSGSGTTPVPIDFDADSATTGKINISFPVSVYKFILYCVKDGQTIGSPANAQQYAMFIGYANADLRYADAITFYMTANTNSTGKGSINLKLYTSNDRDTTSANLWKVPAGYTVTTGVYSKVDNSLKYPATTPDETLALSTSDAAIDGKAFTQTSVDPGTYNFVVTFTTTRAGKTVNYYYSDEIIILANQETSGNVFIPNILEKEPDAPSGFIVAYADAVTPDDSYYYAQFAWADNSNNERSFEIDLVKVNDNADNTQGATPGYKLGKVPTSDDEWDDILGTTYGADGDVVTYTWETYQTSEFNANPNKYALIKNNTTAVFLLELGSRYLARVRAVNEAGASSYAYLHITDGVKVGGASEADVTITLPDATTKDIAVKNTIYYVVNDGTNDVAVSKIDTTNANIPSTVMNAFQAVDDGATPTPAITADVYTVNRYRIEYILGAGAFKGALTTPPSTYAALAAAAVPKTVVYATQMIKPAATLSVVGEPILNPDGNVSGATTGDGSTYVSTTDATVTGGTLNLIANDQKFNRWLVESEDDKGADTPSGNRYPRTWNEWDTSDSSNPVWKPIASGTTPASGTQTRYIPNAYTGHTNLKLFANFALDSTATVQIVDYTAFEWKGYGDTWTYDDDASAPVTHYVTTSNPNLDTATPKYAGKSTADGSDKDYTPTLVKVSDVSLTGTDTSNNEVNFPTLEEDGSSTPKKVYCAKGSYVTVSASTTPTITFTLNKSTCGYDKVALKVRRTDTLVSKYYKEVSLTPNATSYTQPASDGTSLGEWSTAPATWMLDVKGWKSGKYEVSILGTSSKVPNKTYSFPIVIDLVD